MLSFLLDPPSGYSGSYYDNKFSIKFDTSHKAEISFLNEQTKQFIEILSVDDGYIYNENTIVLLNSNKVNGYINLFNKDKMNERLNDFFSVNITCQINYIDDKNNNIKTEKETLTFYNESKSLDINIIPFDLKIEKNSITDEEDLKLFFVCDTEQKFELSIKSSITSINNYVFEIFVKRGTTEINIPVRMIISDLNIPINTNREFDIYWTKFEGVNYQKFYNRKFIKIPNTKLKIIHSDLMPRQQLPIGVLGEKLSSDFVLSDRYLVHTHKTFSGFGSMPINMNRIKKMVMLHNEAQTMQKLGRNIESSQVDIEHQNNLKINRKEIRNSTKISEPLNRNFLRSLNEFSVESQTAKVINTTKTENKPSGCGCARKQK